MPHPGSCAHGTRRSGRLVTVARTCSLASGRSSRSATAPGAPAGRDDGRIDQWLQVRRIEDDGVGGDPVRRDPHPLGRRDVDAVERRRQAGVDGPQDGRVHRAGGVAEPVEEVERAVDVEQHVVDGRGRAEQLQHGRIRLGRFVQSL